MNIVRLRLLSLAMLLAASGLLAAEVESELSDLLDAFLHGASVNDAAVHERFWADDLIYTSSSGARFGKAEIMAGLAQSQEPATGLRYSARDLRIQRFENIAVLTFQLVAEQPDAPTELFYNTGILRQIDGRWQALVWQATRSVSQLD
ncbi:MAG: nuclear transport factor 2 family protein [Wenzhouxiangella sp.]